MSDFEQREDGFIWYLGESYQEVGLRDGCFIQGVLSGIWQFKPTDFFPSSSSKAFREVADKLDELNAVKNDSEK